MSSSITSISSGKSPRKSITENLVVSNEKSQDEQRNSQLFASTEVNVQTVIPTKQEKSDALNQLSKKYILDRDHIGHEEMNSVITYIFTDTKGVKFDKDICAELDKLKINRGRDRGCTKSMLDVAATVYIASIVKSDEEHGVNKLKEIFANGFAEAFRIFLRSNGVQDDTINRIPRSYFRTIKYTGISYIKFNNYVLDISSYGNKILHGLNNPLKNHILRDTFTTEAIAEKKNDARNYYNDICGKVANIQPVAVKEQCKLQLIYFLKILNLTQRKNCISDMDYRHLKTIAEPIFSALNITGEVEQLQFINHGMFLNFHSNRGMHLKRYLVKIPVIALGLSALLLAIAPLAHGGWTALVVAGGVMGVLIAIGATIDITNILQTGATGLKESWRNLNSGDSLASYTNSTRDIFIKLLNVQDSDQPAITPKNYKSHHLWSKVPKTSNILKFFSNKNKLDADQQMDTHKLIMQGMYNSGNQIRNTELSKICSNFQPISVQMKANEVSSLGLVEQIKEDNQLIEQ